MRATRSQPEEWLTAIPLLYLARLAAQSDKPREPAQFPIELPKLFS